MDTQSTTSQSTLAYCQAKLHSLTDLHEDIVALVSGLQNHACSNCASKYNTLVNELIRSIIFSELSWKLMMSEIINAFSIEFIKREKEKMELLLQDIAAQTVANRSSFGGTSLSDPTTRTDLLQVLSALRRELLWLEDLPK